MNPRYQSFSVAGLADGAGSSPSRVVPDPVSNITVSIHSRDASERRRDEKLRTLKHEKKVLLQQLHDLAT